MIADSLDVLSKVDIFYDNALDNILYVLIAVFSAAVVLVGVVMPIVIGYLQRKDHKEKIEELKSEFESKIKIANSEYDKKLEKANSELEVKVRKAEIDLTAKINEETNDLSKKLNKEYGELNYIIQSIEKDFNEKSSALFSELSRSIAKETEHLKSEINEKIGGAKEEVLRDFIQRIKPLQTQAEIFKGLTLLISAKDYFEEGKYAKAFEQSIMASQKFIQNECELAEFSTKVVSESYELMEHPNLFNYWTKYLNVATEQMQKETNNNKLFPKSREVIFKLRKQIITLFNSKTTEY